MSRVLHRLRGRGAPTDPEVMAVGDALALELLARGEPVTVRVRGRSMWPFLRPGDRVLLSPDAAAARLGAVVLWVDEGGAWRLHRVVARIGPWVWLKGDALPALDGRVRRKDLRAVVQQVHRKDQVVAPGGGKAVAFSLANGAARFVVKFAWREARGRVKRGVEARRRARAAAGA